MRGSFHLTRITALLPLLLVTGRAGAYERERTSAGAPLHWTKRVAVGVEFALEDPAGERLSTASRAAFDRWSNAGAAIAIRYLGPADTATIGDRLSTVAALAPWDARRFGAGSRTLAHTELITGARTGTISEADIFLDAEFFRFADVLGPPADPTAVDAQSVVLHETGHLLGLAHSCGDAGGHFPDCFSVPDDPPGTQATILEAVMAPSLSVGRARRTLGEDDRAGLIAIYRAATGSVASPSIAEVTRDCPSGGLRVNGGGWPASPQVVLRFASGRTATAAIASATSEAITLAPLELPTNEGAVDVLVRGEGGRYAAAYAIAPAPCGAAIDGGVSVDGGDGAPAPAGCGCRASERQSAGAPGLALLILGLLLRRRLRYQSAPTAKIGPKKPPPAVSGM